MHKKLLPAFFFFYTFTLFSGGYWAKGRLLSKLPHFSNVTELGDFVAFPDNSNSETPYTAFLNLLAVTNSENCEENFNKLAVCFDYDMTLFEPGREKYSLRSPILPLLIAELIRCNAEVSICSRNGQIDEKGRDRFEIAKETFGDVFKGYFTVSPDFDKTKTAIALTAKGDKDIVLLVDDSLDELNKITDPRIFKLHYAVRRFTSVLEGQELENDIADQQTAYKNEEIKFVRRVEKELKQR